jgi:hypothetical protein
MGPLIERAASIKISTGVGVELINRGPLVLFNKQGMT